MTKFLKALTMVLAASLIVSCGNDGDDKQKASTFYAVSQEDNGLKVTTSKPIAFVNIMGIQSGSTLSINGLVVTIGDSRDELEIFGLESASGSIELKIIYKDGGLDMLDLAKYKN